MSLSIASQLPDGKGDRTTPCPYIGLRYFEESDAGLFYGRDEHTAEILGKVARDRFVAILGSSGSGKSSLVRAGLLPELRSGMIPQAGPRWRVVEFKPGNAPLDELSQALQSGLGVSNAKDLVEEGPLGLVNAVAAAKLPENTSILVIADQFEEVFRFQREERDRGRESQAVEQCRALVRKLLDAAGQTAIPIYILLVMRSDYLGECAQFLDLPERISRSMYLVPRLRRDQVQEVIEAPVSGDIEPALVQELLGKAGGDPDQLPRLQHLLTRVWKLAAGGRLEMNHYDAAGGWEDALAKNLNEVCESVSAPEAAIVRLFQQLSDLDEGNRVVRRRATLDELIEVCGAEVTEVVTAFRAAGFIRSGCPVDITHECILRNWDKVRKWLREEIKARDFYREIKARRERDAKLSGRDLKSAQKYLESGHYSAGWAARYGGATDFETVRRFVLDSERSERRARLLQRGLIFGVLGLLVAIMVGLAVFTWRLRIEKNKAQAASTDALKNAYKARDSALVADQAAAAARANAAKALESKREAVLETEVAKKAQELATKEKREADSQRQRADGEALRASQALTALQEYIGKNEAARSGQRPTETAKVNHEPTEKPEPGTGNPATTVPPPPPRSSAGFSGRDLARLYNFPEELNGKGQTIALIELGGGYTASDLSAYFARLNLRTPEVSVVSIDGGQNQPGGDADGQVTGDIEVAGAVAPAARIVVFFAPNTTQGFVDAVSAAVHNREHSPSVIAIGWGGPETSWTPQAIQAINEGLKDAAALGVTVVAPSGDMGVTAGLPGLRAVDFPASSPWVLACGGTSLVASSGRIISERVWNDANMGAAGGGFSSVFPAPPYQGKLSVPKITEGQAQLADSGKLPGRGIPDVASHASPENGFRVYLHGASTVIGGTSMVTPFWAGLIALVNQDLGSSVGFLNPILYQTLGPAGVFRNILEGNNSYGNVKGYSAGPGWNAASGWGSPDGVKMISALKKATAHGSLSK